MTEKNGLTITLTTLYGVGYILGEVGCRTHLQFSQYGNLIKNLEGYQPEPWKTEEVFAVSVLENSKGDWEVFQSKQKKIKGTKHKKKYLRDLKNFLEQVKVLVPMRREFEHGEIKYKQTFYVFPNSFPNSKEVQSRVVGYLNDLERLVK